MIDDMNLQAEVDDTNKPVGINDDQIEKLADMLADRIAKAPPFESVIYSAQEAAEYLRVSKNYLLNNLRSRQGFPKPVSWSGEKRMATPKWFAGDLRDWMRKNKAK